MSITQSIYKNLVKKPQSCFWQASDETKMTSLTSFKQSLPIERNLTSGRNRGSDRETDTVRHARTDWQTKSSTGIIATLLSKATDTSLTLIVLKVFILKNSDWFFL